ncbi:NAD-dependent epimerase/dehydratase family protein [Phenylobacterium sp.]|uniref:NAD-dependent epimerase/dehydratase family protein n=1 Tax=Phenylobacterium sp. TaxID=1871053 RepID=UPI00395327EE
MTKPLALVIGATGGVGGAIAGRLVQDGWRVRAPHRDPDRARATGGRPGLEWTPGDAMDAASIVAAADGAEIVVHAVNPPGYRNWAGLQAPMLASSIAAARASGARLLFPGTVYNYGPDAFPAIAETAPQSPVSRKGAIRVQMERVLREADVPVLLVRAGDFFGPRPGNNWFSQGLVRPGRPIGAVSYPGPLDVAHAWAYLPDVAEAFVRLLRTPLGGFEAFHLRGQVLTGHEMVAALEAAADRRLAVRRLPWMAIAAAAPFNETLREMREMRYLWRRPVLLANDRIVAALGEEPHTPIVEALRATLAGQGSLPGSGPGALRKAA